MIHTIDDQRVLARAHNERDEALEQLVQRVPPPHHASWADEVRMRVAVRMAAIASRTAR
jgi:hypothetical protein